MRRNLETTISRLQVNRRLFRFISGPGGCASLTALLGMAFCLFEYWDWNQALIETSYDLPLRWRPTRSPSEVLIIEEDRPSVTHLDQPKYSPWNRNLHAELLNRLAQAGTGPVIFDLFFEEPTTNDQLFVRALRQFPTHVILASSLDFDSGPSENLSRGEDSFSTNRLPFRRAADVGLPRVILPQWSLIEAAARSSAETPHGYNQVTMDRDGVVRSIMPAKIVVLETNKIGVFKNRNGVSSYVYQLDFAGWLAARPANAQSVLTQHSPLARTPEPLWLNYYGPPGTIPTLSYETALSCTNLDLFRNKFIFIGARPALSYAVNGKDSFFHPFSRTGQISGLEIHATILSNYLRGESLTRLESVVELAIILTFGGVFGWQLPGLRLPTAFIWSGIAAVAVTSASVASVWWLNLWFPWLIIVAVQIPTVTLWSLMRHSIRSQFETERMMRMLGVYTSKEVAEAAAWNPELLRRGGENRELSIVFTDIAGFARFGELVEREDLERILQGYWDEVLDCVIEKNGIVLNILGDSVLAIWNAPLSPQAEHARLACEAAALLQERIDNYNRGLKGLRLTTRVGLHRGQALVGNYGSDKHMVYTALGETINLASRLESLNKYLGTQILASRAIQKSVEGHIPARNIGFFRFQGFARPTDVFEIMAATHPARNNREWLDAFAEGLKHFRLQNFDLAEGAWRAALAIHPGDGVARFYLEEELPRRRTTIPTKEEAEFGVVPLPGK